jgi:hypothetical protein
MNKNKKTKNFKEFEEGLTSFYDAPEYVVKPAKDDKGFFLFQKAFKNQKKYYEPFIRSTNQDLKNH